MHYEAGLRVIDRLLTEVGAFFSNTRRSSGTCNATQPKMIEDATRAFSAR